MAQDEDMHERRAAGPACKIIFFLFYSLKLTHHTAPRLNQFVEVNINKWTVADWRAGV